MHRWVIPASQLQYTPELSQYLHIIILVCIGWKKRPNSRALKKSRTQKNINNIRQIAFLLVNTSNSAYLEPQCWFCSEGLLLLGDPGVHLLADGRPVLVAPPQLQHRQVIKKVKSVGNFRNWWEKRNCRHTAVIPIRRLPGGVYTDRH